MQEAAHGRQPGSRVDEFTELGHVLSPCCQISVMVYIGPCNHSSNRSMAMKRSLVVVLSFVSLTCWAQYGVDQDLQSAVNAGNQAWINGMRSGDGSVIASTYAPDAVNCTADGQCVSGTSAIAAQLRSRISSMGPASTANVSITSLVRDRDLAYEWGFAEADFGGDR